MRYISVIDLKNAMQSESQPILGDTAERLGFPN